MKTTNVQIRRPTYHRLTYNIVHEFCVIGLLMCAHSLFSCYVACNTNASVVYEIRFTYLFTYTVIAFSNKSYVLDTVLTETLALFGDFPVDFPQVCGREAS